MMNFTLDDITDDGRIWAVKYKDKDENELDQLFSYWGDAFRLRNFFREHKDDLLKYFKITDIDEAVLDTIDDGLALKAVVLDFDNVSALDTFFRPLVDGKPDYYLARSKGKGHNREKHVSWLRIYAIKLEMNRYIITGGAIKLTPKMQDRNHTLIELNKLYQIRKSLKDEEGIVDAEGFDEYMEGI